MQDFIKNTRLPLAALGINWFRNHVGRVTHIVQERRSLMCTVLLYFNPLNTHSNQKQSDNSDEIL